MRAIFALMAAGCLAASGAAAQHGENEQHGAHDATMSHDFKGVEQWVERFEDPARRDWQKPSVVLLTLGLEVGDRVADLGAGTGYFIPWLSSLVEQKGKVYAVDVEPEMLEYIAKRQDIAYDNVVTILADPDDPKLPPDELDAILIVDTWHHIDKRIEYLDHLARSLRRGGRVVVIDFRKGELPVGPPAGSKLGRDDVVKEFEKGGWRLVSESVALPYQYLLVFYPPL